MNERNRNNLAPVNFDLKSDQDPVSPIDFYAEPKKDNRQFVDASPALLLGVVMYYLIHLWVKGFSEIPIGTVSSIAAVISLPMAVMLNSLHNYARTRSDKAFQAKEAMKAANAGIIVYINTCKHETRRLCYNLYSALLRSIYCEAMRREYRVTFGAGEVLSNSNEPILQWLKMALEKAGIDNTVIGNNGRMHQMLAAQEAIESLTKSPIPFSMFLVIAILFLLSNATLSMLIALTVGTISFWIGAGLSAGFTYCVALVCLVARNRSMPFGTRRGEIELNELFYVIEEKNSRAQRATQLFSSSQI